MTTQAKTSDILAILRVCEYKEEQRQHLCFSIFSLSIDLFEQKNRRQTQIPSHVTHLMLRDSKAP